MSRCGRCRSGVATTLAMAVLLLDVAGASASFGVAGFDGQTAASGGGSFTQAGGHPYSVSTTISFNQTTDGKGNALPDEAVRNVRIALPAGLVGDPLATPTRCTEAELMAGTQALSISGFCPAGSQVGMATLVFNAGVGTYVLPVYNMVPAADEPAQLGFRFLTTDAHIDTAVRKIDGSYRVVAALHDISNTAPLLGATLTIWGVPADPSHDSQRGKCAETPEADLCSAGIAQRPFVTMPTACTSSQVGLETSLHAESWLGSSDDAGFFSHLPPGLPVPGPQQGPTGCAGVPFSPSLALQPTTHAADSPTGLRVDLSIPQTGLEVPGAVATSHLKDAVVELPKGMSVNPAAAAGLGACASEQIGLDDDEEDECPNSSKLGSLEIETPLLADPVRGSVYLAAQKDNPFGSLLAIYIVAEGPGFVIKLPGHIEAEADGRLVIRFDDGPQLPFSSLHLDFFAGPRAALRTPPSCGAYTTRATLTPWSGTAPVELASSFEVTSGPNGGPCPGGSFAPRLDAGTSDPIAGRYSPLAIRLSREDGTQELAGLDLSFPKGLTAKLAGVSYCPESALASISVSEGAGMAQLASPACPSTSRIGTVSAGAGAGSNPFYVDTGKVYLAGPYKGAPLSVAVVAPALAGPFDLGNVVVRAALGVDPSTAQVQIVSDPIPTVLDGIPLDLRDVRMLSDRSEFILNPTNCDPMAFAGSATSARGISAPLVERFQVGSCARLPFKPRLSMRLFGSTRRNAHPRLRAVFTAGKREAGVGRVAVNLPHSEFLDEAHIDTVCTRRQFAGDECPAGSVYGYAKAITPLLERPLEGPVYLRSSSHLLPDLVVALRGQVEIDLEGRIDSANGGIRTTFETIPDAPVTKFVLSMRGGARGLLVNSRDLCAAPAFAVVEIDGQNGKIADRHPPLKSSCGERPRDEKGR